MPLLSEVFATLGVNGVNEVTDDTTKWNVNDHLSNKTYVANFANFKHIAFAKLVMNKFFLFLLSWLGFFGITAQTQNAVPDYASLVNPLMGTASSYELSADNTYPAICRPWGMNFWTPQTGKNGNGWQYTYTAHRLRGFKQTHQPSPWINDYGQFSLMPLVGRGVFDEEGRASWFSHLSEKATPYSYEVYLADHDVRAELVPTERACLMRFTFPQTDSAWVAIDAFDGGSAVAIDTLHRRISGYTTKNSGGVADGFCCWFVVEFDTPFSVVRTVLDGQQADTLEARGNHSPTHNAAPPRPMHPTPCRAMNETESLQPLKKAGTLKCRPFNFILMSRRIRD